MLFDILVPSLAFSAFKGAFSTVGGNRVLFITGPKSREAGPQPTRRQRHYADSFSPLPGQKGEFTFGVRDSATSYAPAAAITPAQDNVAAKHYDVITFSIPQVLPSTCTQWGPDLKRHPWQQATDVSDFRHECVSL